MQLVSKDFRKGTVTIRLTDPEDLWYLRHLIDPGDLLKGKTTRKVKIGDGDNASVAKKTITLQIEVESVDFDQDNNSLRANGKIREGPEYIPQGSYHAIALEIGEEFILQKRTWLAYQKQKLEEAVEQKYEYLLCLLDREEALFSLTKKTGYMILVKIKGDVPKKAKDTEVKKDFHQEILKTLETYAERYHPEQIIIASPVFYKEDLFKKITNKDLKKKITLATCSDVTEQALDEVMKSPELRSVLKNSRAREEKLLVDELLHEINKEQLAVYGWKETKRAAEAKAVSKLLLTDAYIKKRRASADYEQLDELLLAVDALKGQIHIISSDHEGGKKLDGLGGIAAIVRYKV